MLSLHYQKKPYLKLCSLLYSKCYSYCMCIFFHTTSYKHENVVHQPNSCFWSVFKTDLVRPPACPRWTHGAGCSKKCDCVEEHSTGCDPKTGSCFCKAAYHGPQCEKGISTHQLIYSRQLQHARNKMVAICVHLHFYPHSEHFQVNYQTCSSQQQIDLVHI